MSFYYYKVEKEREKPPTYGFRKAEAEEIASIVQRLSRPTYSSLIHSEEPKHLHNYQFIRDQSARRRTPSACRKRPPSFEYEEWMDDRRFHDWELQRVLRRLQKSTETSENRNVAFSNEVRRVVKQQTRPKTSVDKTKLLDRLSRPTTASRAKSVNDCHLCDEESLENNKHLIPFEYEYADDREAEPEEVDKIILRMRTPTYASSRGVKSCTRLTVTSNDIDEVGLRRRIPLVSGLARSTTVQEIVQRLSPSKRHGYKTSATEISIR